MLRLRHFQRVNENIKCISSHMFGLHLQKRSAYGFQGSGCPPAMESPSICPPSTYIPLLYSLNNPLTTTSLTETSLVIATSHSSLYYPDTSSIFILVIRTKYDMPLGYTLMQDPMVSLTGVYSVYGAGVYNHR